MFCIGAFRPQYSTANNQGNFVKFNKVFFCNHKYFLFEFVLRIFGVDYLCGPP